MHQVLIKDFYYQKFIPGQSIGKGILLVSNLGWVLFLKVYFLDPLEKSTAGFSKSLSDP
jgi:hypothetical protein